MPKYFSNPDDLAAVGLYYCPRKCNVCGSMKAVTDESVRCIYCGIELVNWEEGDILIAKHKKWSPSCNFVNKRLKAERQLPEFNTESERKKSFKLWTKSFINSDELAAVGFYYCPRSFDVCGNMKSDIDDRVRCFECEIELVH